MLETRVVAEVGRGYGVIHIAVIAMVGEVEDANRAPQGMFTQPGNEKKPEILGDLHIERVKVGKRRLLGGPT